ncbi:phage terminase small subunit P27 family [Nitrosomonas eutropha]|uniref:P27 family predicted phage terminase small subunit n=2 Tax=Nitrosomonas eutropha TaxID=916 RepID=A0ABX5MB42_9PROT|nr:phage terminase small subunit P27 family [Nitrosomonas eutropha]ABI59719.1 phage terminase, small subunit, putative, P27 family protein [Nitrosomonas eutropha C91]PXV82482.1 P27 family predicted phage terminase small subunit [Nitrosomonas eutropha]
MRGRYPKPTHLKIVEGNRGKRGVNKQEPDPAYLNDLAAPDYFSAGAKIVWSEIVPGLREAKLLTEVDVPMLHMACEAIATYRRAALECGQEYTEPGAKERKSISYWEMVKSMAFKQAMTALQQFGMSPAARTRIAVQPQQTLPGLEETSETYLT